MELLDLEWCITNNFQWLNWYWWFDCTLIPHTQQSAWSLSHTYWITCSHYSIVCILPDLCNCRYILICVGFYYMTGGLNLFFRDLFFSVCIASLLLWIYPNVCSFYVSASLVKWFLRNVDFFVGIIFKCGLLLLPNIRWIYIWSNGSYQFLVSYESISYINNFLPNIDPATIVSAG